jgi:citrate synthase
MKELRVGLEGVAIAESAISSVNGEKGELIYRGEWVENITKDHAYEDIVHLLWFGHLPSPAEKTAFQAQLVANRQIPDYIKALIQKLPKELKPMAVLRTAISALVMPGDAWPPTYEQAIQILAKAPTILAYYYNLTNGLPDRAPNPDLGHAANYLYMLHGSEPSEVDVKALDTYWMLSADHDMNASTFTSRVVTSTQADIVSAVVGAISALIGPLHGGTPSLIDDMLDSIGTEENAEPWLRAQLDQGKRLMGFGHRIYKVYDPRAAALKEMVKKYAHEDKYLKLSLVIEEAAIKLLQEYKPGRHLYPNLEFWAAGILRTIKLPRTLYTPTFCLSRIGGWSAHIVEQAGNNRLIRPSCIYTGPQPKEPSPRTKRA